MMTNAGAGAADQAAKELEKKLKKVYAQAVKEMTATLTEFTDEYGKQLAEKQAKVAAGKMTQAQLGAWMHGKDKIIEKMVAQIDQMSGTLLAANQKALGMVNGEMVSVFAENVNYQSYQLEKKAKMDLMFAVYDEHTVESLIKNDPDLLPQKTVNPAKDKAWNQKLITNAVTQAVIQGESIPNLAKRVAASVGSTDMSAMVRYARTAMTGAQNSGRMEMLHRAQDMGIKVKKQWLATLDSRTRDSHQAMDGETVGVDDKFSNGLLYPGDPSGKPGEVWNCRCTMVYDYEGFPNDPTTDQRLQYDDYYTTHKDKDGKVHQVYHRTGSSLITSMSYQEWKAAKQASVLNDLNTAKMNLATAQMQLIQHKVSEKKVYKDIWKDPVTLADYPAKAASIQAKRDYYLTEIDKLKTAISNGESWASPDKVKELQKKKRLLDEFERNGKMLEARNAAMKQVQDIYNQINLQKTATAPAVAKPKAAKKATTAPAASGGTSTGAAAKASSQGPTAAAAGDPFGPDAYSQARKDAALWTTSRAKVDSMMRDRTGEVWRAASAEERDAIFEYTQSYSKYNEPLRGYEYGTNRYLGVGNTDLDAGYKHNGDRMNRMTDLIDKCSYDHDQWFQRGVRFAGMDKFFQCDMSLLQGGTQKELQKALLGKTVTEHAFMSMGSAKGKGFIGDILLNIYAPRGTKMMYAEPFSYYGYDKNGRMNRDNGIKWDGKSKQKVFGQEFETILQQGTQFRIAKVEKVGRQLYFDIEIIGQSRRQRWKK